MRCLARLFADSPMTLGGQNERIRLPEIAVADCAFPIIGGQRSPQLTTGLGRAITESQSNDATCVAFQGQPNPDHMALLTNKRPEFIEFQDRTFNQWSDRLSNRCQVFFLRIV